MGEAHACQCGDVPQRLGSDDGLPANPACENNPFARVTQCARSGVVTVPKWRPLQHVRTPVLLRGRNLTPYVADPRIRRLAPSCRLQRRLISESWSQHDSEGRISADRQPVQSTGARCTAEGAAEDTMGATATSRATSNRQRRTRPSNKGNSSNKAGTAPLLRQAKGKGASTSRPERTQATLAPRR